MKNIVLTGFMGTGKTSVGRILASMLGLGFVDTDEEIEKSNCKTITEIFGCYGVKHFRHEESLTIKKISDRGNLVIATGGGAVLNPDNVAALKKTGIIVLLRSSPEAVYSRIGSDNNRPLLAGVEDPLQKIKELMQQREDMYRESADFEVISNDSKELVAAEIVRLLKERKYI